MLVLPDSLDVGEVSDGYHTFNELYDHRCTLFLALMSKYKLDAWYSKLHDDGSSFEGFYIAGINLPSGTVTYHIPDNMLHLVKKTGASELLNAPKWDGHTSDDVVNRLQESI